jgi:hypothetical protein
MRRADPCACAVDLLEAHASEEKVALTEIEEAVGLYRQLVAGLLSLDEDYLEPKG